MSRDPVTRGGPGARLAAALLALPLAGCGKGDAGAAPPPSLAPPARPVDGAGGAGGAGGVSGAGAGAAVPGWPELRGLVLARPAWLVELEPVVPRPELVAHAPVVVGDRVLVAGSRVDHRGLDLASGAEAWRRPGGAALARPLALGRGDVVLLRECDGGVAAPTDHAVLACFDRIDPAAIAVRSGGRLHAPAGEAGACVAGGGAWSLAGDDPAALVLGRNTCRFVVDLGDGLARRVADLAPPPEPAEDVVGHDGDAPWRQVVGGGRSEVVRGAGAGPRLPGLTVLAAARVAGRDAGAVVVRADSSLARDFLAGYVGAAVTWVWPLPPPPDGARAGPVGLTADDRGVTIFFDAHRVARFTAPWAAPTRDR